MSKLNVDQKPIKRLFEDKKTYFLIPDYQRPYAGDYEIISGTAYEIPIENYPVVDKEKSIGNPLEPLY